MKTKNITYFTIGIPTYEAGESLIATLSSIYKQTLFKTHIKEVILMVDGNKIAPNILENIRNPRLKIIYGRERKGQSTRINDIFKVAKTELLLLTNDDVILEKNLLKKILSTYNRTSPDLIPGDVKPMNPRNLLQKIIYTGYELTDSLSANWNQKDNYLSCNGRLICLSKKLYKKINIPEKLWNNDAYIYLFSKINNYSFGYAKGATCQYLLPTTLEEHIKQSTKFKASFTDNQKHFKQSLDSFYKIPRRIIINSAFSHFIKNPLGLTAYSFVYFLTAISKFDKNLHKRGFWQTDKTTKNIKLIITVLLHLVTNPLLDLTNF